MEMWHNGKQAGGATIALRTTKPRAGAASEDFITSAPSSALARRLPPAHLTGQKHVV